MQFAIELLQATTIFRIFRMQLTFKEGSLEMQHAVDKFARGSVNWPIPTDKNTRNKYPRDCHGLELGAIRVWRKIGHYYL